MLSIPIFHLVIEISAGKDSCTRMAVRQELRDGGKTPEFHNFSSVPQFLRRNANALRWNGESLTAQETGDTLRFRLRFDIGNQALKESLQTPDSRCRALQSRPARARNPLRGCGNGTS